MKIHVQLRWAVIMATFAMSGCSLSERSSDFADPKAAGTVPMQAQACGSGCVGNGMEMTLGMVQPTEPSIFIVVAGNEPILKVTVAAHDNVWAEINHPLVGDCQVDVKVNGSKVDSSSSKVGVYRTYLVAAGT